MYVSLDSLVLNLSWHVLSWCAFKWWKTAKIQHTEEAQHKYGLKLLKANLTSSTTAVVLTTFTQIKVLIPHYKNISLQILI